MELAAKFSLRAPRRSEVGQQPIAICSGLCRFLFAMILPSLSGHHAGRKTLISHGPINRGPASISIIFGRREARQAIRREVEYQRVALSLARQPGAPDTLTG